MFEKLKPNRNEQPSPAVQLSADNWSVEQKHAIARCSGQALSELEHILRDDAWPRAWWTRMLSYLQLRQEDLGKTHEQT